MRASMHLVLGHARHRIDSARVHAGNNTTSDSGSVLSLPKLNLQFLSLYDLFHRCFTLYRLESAVGIRADVVEAVSRGKRVTAVMYPEVRRGLQ